jgi:hypothetical protein
MTNLSPEQNNSSEADAMDFDELDHEEWEACDHDEDELPSLADIFGYENDEDNEEAALDHVLKIQENAD